MAEGEAGFLIGISAAGRVFDDSSTREKDEKLSGEAYRGGKESVALLDLQETHRFDAQVTRPFSGGQYVGGQSDKLPPHTIAPALNSTVAKFRLQL